MFYQIRFLGLGVVLGERSFFQGNERSFFQGNERDKNRTERKRKKTHAQSLGLGVVYIVNLSRPFRPQHIHLSRPLKTIYSFIQAFQTLAYPSIQASYNYIFIYLGLSDLYIYRPTAPLRHLQLCIQASRTFIYLYRPLRPAYLYIQASQTCMCDSEHMFSCPQQEMDLYGMSKRQVYSGMHKTVE